MNNSVPQEFMETWRRIIVSFVSHKSKQKTKDTHSVILHSNYFDLFKWVTFFRVTYFVQLVSTLLSDDFFKLY